MGDVRRAISYSSSRRPRSSMVNGGESSFSRKRPRLPPPPPRRRLRLLLRPPRPLGYYEDDVVDDDGSHGHRDDDDDREEDEDEEQSASEDDRGRRSSRGGESSDGSDAADDVVETRGVAEEEDSDDDRPVRVVSRAPPPILVRRSSTCTAPSSAPAPPESSSSDSSSVMMRNVTLENPSALDCSICYHPLKSPIFQCAVGHVVCSPCHDKLAAGQQQATTRCHICRVALPDGYSRCNAMEQVVESIRVPCPHAAHGCAARPAYHNRDAHARACAHRPCRCPGAGCGFAGSVRTTALLEHFAAAHGWPCSAGSTSTIFGGFDVSLVNGFNVVTVAVTANADDQGTASMTTEEEQYTLVLKVEQQAAPVCSAITAFCIHPSNTGTVSLGLSYYRRWRRDSDLRSRYLQSSQLDVVCTDLSNGMPGPSSCFPLLVPTWPAAPGGEDDEDDVMRVTVNYIHAATNHQL